MNAPAAALRLSLILLFLFPSAIRAEENAPAIRKPLCARIPTTRFQLQGVVSDYVRAVSDRWLKLVPESDPGMLEMFRDRDRLPHRDMVPWAGEFVGKYLTGGVQVYRLTRDPELKAVLADVVRELVSLQASDGYLGPWPKANRLANRAPNAGKSGGDTWDTWGHYHVLLGLLLWHDETGDQRALDSARRIGDLLCEKFLGNKKPRLVETGSTEMNLAPVHALCLLYRQTRQRRHLDLARQIVEEFAATSSAGRPLAGDYLNSALAGKEFFEIPKPRWESLHPILGLVELYYLTGDERFQKAFEHWWWSIVKLERHNNGGFSSGEQARGNPYDRGAIETCCTIAWMALSVEMLRLTENPLVADELELSTLNSVLGMHSPSGRWATYNTPMDGVRRASAHEIVFQAREGTPELNCCSVNSPRGLGYLSDWAVLRDAEGLVWNWYGPCRVSTTLRDGLSVQFTQETDYPRDGKIRLRVGPSSPADFTLKLRIPAWSVRTRVAVNGVAVENVEPATYLRLARTWKPKDTVDIDLDFSLHYWTGERECRDRASIYRGPVLLTYDRRFNTMDPQALPELEARKLSGRRVEWGGERKPFLLLEFPTVEGGTLRLCDFASAGNGGSPYVSWLRVRDTPAPHFDRKNPLRSGRAPDGS